MASAMPEQDRLCSGDVLTTQPEARASGNDPLPYARRVPSGDQ